MKTPRKGVSLIEALMAIFVTAIGLLSLLVLFPVGAFRMAQAITDDRSAHLASNAFALVQAHNFRDDPLETNINGPNPPGAFAYLRGPTGAVLITNADGPSYPVYVDPVGYTGGQNGPLGAVGTILNSGIPRPRLQSFPNQLAPIATPSDARRWFALPDDLGYSTNDSFLGLAADTTTVPARDGSYTVAYMLRRPKFAVPSIVETTVVVYKNRPSIGGENAYVLNPAVLPFDINNTEVQITPVAGQEAPPIRKGSWVLDATVLSATGTAEPHGFFYRVVNVTDNGGGSMTIELANKPKMSTLGNPNGVLVVMEHVVEVFEKGPGWKP